MTGNSGEFRATTSDEPRQQRFGASRRPGEKPPEFIWTIDTADGEAAQQLDIAQARVIREVLQWQRTRHPSISKHSAPDPAAPTEDDGSD
ncbi:hypothetical protein [Actinomadura sp. SCN-SB]|uniref:hypothetical protein n=1 Tax=Actinomadura sp. SCN-SB TaxID=3373092 RepID=UPI0037531E0F